MESESQIVPQIKQPKNAIAQPYRAKLLSTTDWYQRPVNYSGVVNSDRSLMPLFQPRLIPILPVVGCSPSSVVHEPSGHDSFESGGASSPSPLESARVSWRLESLGGRRCCVGAVVVRRE